MGRGISKVELEGIRKFKSGKVRDIYDLDDRLLIVATDRISAFDYVLPSPIPDKGKILTGLSGFWFDFMAPVLPNHVISSEIEDLPPELQAQRDKIEGRFMLVMKAEVLEVECVARGYLAGSGWKEYKQKGSICGIRLPRGLIEAAELPEPIFTPATKAKAGHDINIPMKTVEEMVGTDLAQRVAETSLAIYNEAKEYGKERGVIIADTKFEFGLIDGELILIDEILTPDSSRFWPAETYRPGGPQLSYDKQFVRDYLESIHWDKKPPVPELPDEIIEKTREKYLDAYRSLVGREPAFA
ncbi:phosphoribosylaminoimidazolesuccinocarboxamide synthase [bacterium]|nr:phosphoribosylaminoimidazolesuccinocarboxamide synthase [bacterium]